MNPLPPARFVAAPDAPLAGIAALVTGGGGGLGSACAARLARDGAAVTIMGRTDLTLIGATERIRSVAGAACRVHTFAGSALESSDVQRAMASAATTADRLGVVVSVVGGGTLKPLVMFTETEFMEQLHRNVVSAYLAIRAAVPHMSNHGGSIICISSTAAAVPYPFMTPYGAAKAAVEGLIRGAALELSPLGIRVNAIRSGAVRTGPANEHLGSSDESIRQYVTTRPIARDGATDDIGAAVRYLAGPESSWVTGQSIAVDGGTELIGAPPYLETLARRRHGDATIDEAMRGSVSVT